MTLNIIFWFIICGNFSLFFSLDIHYCGKYEECICDPNRNSVACTGEKVLKIPEISTHRRQRVSTLKFGHSGVRMLSGLTHNTWPALKRIILENNIYMNCNKTMEYLHREFRERIEIITDCFVHGEPVPYTFLQNVTEEFTTKFQQTSQMTDSDHLLPGPTSSHYLTTHTVQTQLPTFYRSTPGTSVQTLPTSFENEGSQQGTTINKREKTEMGTGGFLSQTGINHTGSGDIENTTTVTVFAHKSQSRLSGKLLLGVCILSPVSVAVIITIVIIVCRKRRVHEAGLLGENAVEMDGVVINPAYEDPVMV